MSKRIVRSRKGTILGGKSVEKFSVPVTSAPDPGPAVMEVYWHPNRPGVEACPEDFAQKLRDANPDLACCRPPAGAPLGMAPAWIVWYRRPRITHYLSPGWKLLFVWRNPETKVPEPLDERVFAVLYASSIFKWGDGAKYFDRALVQVERDRKAIRDKDYDNNRKAKQREYLKTHRISNIGDGSRSALHDGGIVPSKGEIAWRESRRRRMMPSEQRQAEDEAIDRARAFASDLGQK